jgi:predicted  nucleic acid-binding Zn-ribbon protein
MSRPNAFGVIERVLNLQDSLTEAHQQLADKNDLLRKLTEQISALQKEVRGFDDVLRQSIREKHRLEEGHAAHLQRIYTAHPEIPWHDPL